MEIIQWSDIRSTREAAADDAAHQYDPVCQESSKTTDTLLVSVTPLLLELLFFINLNSETRRIQARSQKCGKSSTNKLELCYVHLDVDVTLENLK